MIQKTTEYEKFTFINGNRTLNPAHLSRLAMSIAKKNMLEQNPIIVNKKLEVIDGQHRLFVCQQSKLPVYYVVVDDAGIDEIMELNTNVRKWSLPDYIDSQVVVGNRQIQWFKNFCDDYGLAPTAGMILVTGSSFHASGSPAVKLSRMEFSDKQRKLGMDAADLLSVIRDFKTRKGQIPHAMLFAIRKIAEEGMTKDVADAIQNRNKVVSVVGDRAEAYKVLMGYVK